MATEFTSADGQTVSLEPDSVRDLKALSTLTRQPEQELVADAIERLRQAMVPSTKPVAPRAGGRGAGKAPKDKQ